MSDMSLIYTDAGDARHVVDTVEGYNRRADTGARLVHITFHRDVNGHDVRCWTAAPIESFEVVA